MRASVADGGRSLSQHSQLGRSSRAIARLSRRARARARTNLPPLPPTKTARRSLGGPQVRDEKKDLAGRLLVGGQVAGADAGDLGGGAGHHIVRLGLTARIGDHPARIAVAAGDFDEGVLLVDADRAGAVDDAGALAAGRELVGEALVGGFHRAVAAAIAFDLGVGAVEDLALARAGEDDHRAVGAVLAGQFDDLLAAAWGREDAVLGDVAVEAGLLGLGGVERRLFGLGSLDVGQGAAAAVAAGAGAGDVRNIGRAVGDDHHARAAGAGDFDDVAVDDGHHVALFFHGALGVGLGDQALD